MIIPPRTPTCDADMLRHPPESKLSKENANQYIKREKSGGMKRGKGRDRGVKDEGPYDDPGGRTKPQVKWKSAAREIDGKRHDREHERGDRGIGLNVQKKYPQKDKNGQLPKREEEGENDERGKNKITAHAGRREPELEHDGKDKNKNGEKMFHFTISTVWTIPMS